MSDGRVTLRSYRLAFELERRLHRIDRFRIPVPYGVPIVGLGYGAVAAVAVVVATGLPVAGELLGLIPWPLRLLLLPAGAAYALCRTGVDGRPAHEALAARLLRRIRPHRLAGLDQACNECSAWLAAVTVVPDERADRYRRGSVSGPATVLLRMPGRAVVRRRTLTVTQIDDAPLYRAREIRLKAGQTLRVR